MFILLMCYLIAVILLQLHPGSLMHKNPQRCKIIHSMCPIGRKDQLVDLKMCICRNILFMLFLWHLLWLLFNDAYIFYPFVML